MIMLPYDLYLTSTYWFAICTGVETISVVVSASEVAVVLFMSSVITRMSLYVDTAVTSCPPSEVAYILLIVGVVLGAEIS